MLEMLKNLKKSIYYICLEYCTTNSDCIESGEICEMHYLKCKANSKWNPDCLPGICKPSTSTTTPDEPRVTTTTPKEETTTKPGENVKLLDSTLFYIQIFCHMIVLKHNFILRIFYLY